MPQGATVQIVRPETQGIGALIRTGLATVVKSDDQRLVIQYNDDWMLVAINLSAAQSEGVTVSRI